jgi:3-phosphoshikimate 1-carboxyvinyltransferase
MDLHVHPGNPLRGEISLPGDKSISHRAALFAALAQGESQIENFLVAGVTEVMLQALSTLGVQWELNENVLTIHGKGFSGLTSPSNQINCGNSGTTLRLLAGALAAANVPTVLDGSPGLRSRPMRRVVDPLQAMGALIDSTDEGTAPLTLGDRPSQVKLRGVEHKLSVPSAQVKTAILLAGLTGDAPTTVSEPAKSRDHTERMLSGMGVHIDQKSVDGNNCITLTPPTRNDLIPIEIIVPGDFSSASFLIVAALITPGSNILIKDVGLNPTRTGLLDVLLDMGANIQVTNRHEQCNEPVGDIQVRYSELKGVQVTGSQVVRMIDEFPIFAVAGAYASGETTVTQASELRFKESDRISSICTQLQAVGVKVNEHEDGFTIKGSEQPIGGEVKPQGDHRLAMSLAVCGLGTEKGNTIKNAEIFLESYPGFVDALRTLGAEVNYG